MTATVLHRGKDQNSFHPAVSGVIAAGLALLAVHTVAPNAFSSFFTSAATHITAPAAAPHIKAESVIGFESNPTFTNTAKTARAPAAVIMHRMIVHPLKKALAESSIEKTRRIEAQVAYQYRLCPQASLPGSNLKKLYAENGNRPVCGG